MTEASIAIKSFQADLPSYLELQRDLLDHGHTAVTVCVPRKDLPAFEPVVAPSFKLLSVERLFHRFGWKPNVAESWHSQQLCKLLLVASSRNEVCWVLDSNTLLQEPLPSPWDRGRVVLALNDLHSNDVLWFDSSARFLGLPSSGPLLDPVNQPLRRCVVRAMLVWLSCLYGSHPLHVLTAAISAGIRRAQPFWTEYGLYRSFAAHVARSAHSFVAGARTVAYYHHDEVGSHTEEWLRELRRARPSMIKLYARRPTYRLDDEELRRLCDRIRECR